MNRYGNVSWVKERKGNDFSFSFILGYEKNSKGRDIIY